MNKRFSTITSVLIILAVIAGGYFIVSKSNPKVDTSNWKTYKNEKFGLEFSYPNTWPDAIETDLYNDSLTLQLEKTFFITYGTYIDKDSGRAKTIDQLKYGKSKEINIDGRRAIRIYDSKIGTPVYILYIQGENNNILSIIDYGGLVEEKTLDEIISDFHFKFTK